MPVIGARSSCCPRAPSIDGMKNRIINQYSTFAKVSVILVSLATSSPNLLSRLAASPHLITRSLARVATSQAIAASPSAFSKSINQLLMKF